MRILFCDDDRLFLEHIVKCVSHYVKEKRLNNIDLVAYCNGDELINHETRCDIAFLDVEMPGKNGLNLCRYLKEHNPWIKIFIVTAHSGYLDAAFDHGAFRFIEKPIDKNLLYARLNKAISDYIKSTVEIAIETKNLIMTIPANEIMCLEYCKRGSIVHTINGSYKTSQTIDQWGKKLTLPYFYKSNRGYIVNMRYVKSFSADSGTIELAYLDKSITAYLTNRKFTDFKSAFYLLKGSLL